MNTHGLTADFGKHAGELYTRIPVSYLRWMVNAGHRHADIARAELDRRGISIIDRGIDISSHAVDTASLRIRKSWHEDRGDQEGLYAWLVRVCEEALVDQEPDEDGRIDHKGVRLVFATGEVCPILKTVMKAKG